MEDNIFDKVHDIDLKKTMDPSKYVGRAKEQVEKYLRDVISPLLEANKDVLGIRAEIQV